MAELPFSPRAFSLAGLTNPDLASLKLGHAVTSARTRPRLGGRTTSLEFALAIQVNDSVRHEKVSEYIRTMLGTSNEDGRADGAFPTAIDSGSRTQKWRITALKQ